MQDTNPTPTICQRLQHHALDTPEAIAILAEGSRPALTYKKLVASLDEIIAQLNSWGIGRNDRVAVALPNGAEMAIAFLGVTACATCAPLNPNYRVAEYDFYLADLEAKALIVQDGFAEPAVEVAKQRNIPIIKLSPLLEQAAGLFTLSGEAISDAVHSGVAQLADTALILHTSGTTSRPKMVPLLGQNLAISATNVSRALALTAGDRCLNVMPLFHIHGLVGALLSSMSAGASIICSTGFDATKFFDWIQDLKPTWYSAVPTMHQSILARAAQHPEIMAAANIRLVRSSSAPLPPQVMQALETTFSAPVIEAYGMTEAAHQMTCNPLPPQARKSGSVGIAAGPKVAIMNEAGDLLTSGEVGEVVIMGSNVTAGYYNNSDANQKAFTNDWFRTGDLGYLDADGYLFLQGRIKEIINRGGEKISPREVDEVLLDHPAIAQVVTFAAPHTLLGEDVAAAVVLEKDATVTEQALQEFAAQRLADFKVPRVVLFLDEIPKGPTGKRQRIGLAKKLGLEASDPEAERPTYVAPRTPVEIDLTQIWQEVLGFEAIGLDDNFFQLGGDSILATQIINRIRDALQVELSFLVFFQQPTIRNMAIAIVAAQAQSVDTDEMALLLAELESMPEKDGETFII